MANSINLIAFGTFGNPNGFKQTFFVGSNDLAKSVKTFDLNTNAIKLFSKSKIYSIRKECANGYNTIAYSIYTYAKEQNSDRSGTFIGSSILFTKKIAKEHITVSQLNEFHNQLVNKNVSNNIISVNHSDEFSVVKPKDFDKIEFNLSEIENINFKLNTNNYLVVFCSISVNSLIHFFDKSIDLLNIYDTIYFTDSKEVAEFVLQKGIFKLIQNVGDKKDFENEINFLNEERKRKRENAISEFENEIKRIIEEKNNSIQLFKSQIDQNERIHIQNSREIEESKKDINKISQFYDDFINKNNNIINQLKNISGAKFEELKQIYFNNRILFNNGLSELKKPNYQIKQITKPKPKSNLNIDQPIHHSNIKQDQTEFNLNAVITKYKIDYFKVATLILSLLLITILVVNFLNRKPYVEPNSNLTGKDLKRVTNKIKHGQNLDEIVKEIYILNPNDIQKPYENFEKTYSSLLYIKNNECFKKKNGVYILKDNNLKIIPSYKKND